MRSIENKVLEDRMKRDMSLVKTKYYTPSIEEFRVGFEYEVFQKGEPYEPNIMYIKELETEDKWYKFKYPDPFLGYNIDRIFKTYKIRVKHLDGSDITSLGFDSIDVRYFKLIKADKLRSIERTEIWISKLGENHYKIIRFDHYKNRGSESVIFSGYIKNKSELKVLLKQLNIT